MRFGALSAGLLLAGLLLGDRAEAHNRMVEFPDHPERLRAVRYAAHGSNEFLAELDSRSISCAPGPARQSPNSETPVLLEGPLHGVELELYRPDTAAKNTGHLMDCRLLLALDDFAMIAADQGIAKIRYNNLFRGRWVQRRGWRHAAGVAIDVVELVKKDGQVLEVLRDFHGSRIGSRTCGEGAETPSDEKARSLRDLVCALDEAKSFNLILTPHYDQRHKNHFHLEVRRGILWFLTQ